MDESLKLILVFLSGPLFGGAIAAVWYYFTKVREPARIKEQQVSSASLREQDRSRQVFGEQQAGRMQDRSNDIQDKLVTFLLASNDGKISEILSTSKDGTSQVITLVLQTSAESAEQGRLIIASLNQTITQQARILAALLELLSRESGTDILAGLSSEVLSGLTSAAIQTPPVKEAERVATVANEPSESTIEVTGKNV